jgi:hypothetical protein
MSRGGSMPDSNVERLSSLPRLSRDGIRKLWKELFDVLPAPQLRRDFMIPILAYRLQERAFGALNARSRARLGQLARAFEMNSNSTTVSTRHLRPGTRLVRQWRNQVHLVRVESTGYEYQGARYQSLSQIARLITGTRWSGPLFFGIRNKKSESDPKEVQ